jgi:hypothetical protein
VKANAATQALELFFLKNAKKFWLQLERKVSDFIQKECSVVSRLKASDALCARARERASFVAEHFTLQ